MYVSWVRRKVGSARMLDTLVVTTDDKKHCDQEGIKHLNNPVALEEFCSGDHHSHYQCCERA